jgi:tRNA(Ile)-lysidine synthase TilS/MesJ
MMCHKIRGLSDRSSDQVYEFLDQKYVREHLLQSMQDIIELATMRNTEIVDKMMLHKIRAFSDPSNDSVNGSLDQNYVREHLLSNIQDLIGLARIKKP